MHSKSELVHLQSSTVLRNQSTRLKKRTPNIHSLISQMVWYYATVYTACCYMIA